jgi:hypothetical protein
VEERLPGKFKALSSVSSTEKKLGHFLKIYLVILVSCAFSMLIILIFVFWSYVLTSYLHIVMNFLTKSL